MRSVCVLEQCICIAEKTHLSSRLLCFIDVWGQLCLTVVYVNGYYGYESQRAEFG